MNNFNVACEAVIDVVKSEFVEKIVQSLVRLCGDVGFVDDKKNVVQMFGACDKRRYVVSVKNIHAWWQSLLGLLNPIFRRDGCK